MVQKGDEAEYLCQLATHPPKALIFHLKVIGKLQAVYRSPSKYFILIICHTS